MIFDEYGKLELYELLGLYGDILETKFLFIYGVITVGGVINLVKPIC